MQKTDFITQTLVFMCLRFVYSSFIVIMVEKYGQRTVSQIIAIKSHEGMGQMKKVMNPGVQQFGLSFYSIDLASPMPRTQESQNAGQRHQPPPLPWYHGTSTSDQPPEAFRSSREPDLARLARVSHPAHKSFKTHLTIINREPDLTRTLCHQTSCYIVH